ncbi:MFS transporter [Amycolatopsis sp. CA-230715]|uniref:MFS transporter n=1 Tax=Amycolatopsis sp. CA-230715 TaxID=2745196 RepID=UPI001C00D6F5|nr:MFS transporter [Amycolatopsis sp. CA-230715]QWF82961.1 Multidrug resistance protein Stp [Amycolatopsis sp. CA-230715]
MITAPTAAGSRLALTAVCLGFLMITLDATIVNLALPAIADDFGGTGIAGLQWVVDSYTIALAAFLLMWGWAGDRFGARRVFVLGTAIFVVASAACAVATGLAVLIVARAVQGFGAAALLPSSLALIVHQFPDARERARALGVWGGMSGIGLAAGPVLGGLSVGLLDWRLVFAVNVPVGLAGIGLARRHVLESEPYQGKRVDWTGQLLGTAALACLVAAFIESGAAAIALFAGAFATTVAFVVVQRRIPEPLVPPAVLRIRAFSAATAIGWLFNFCLYGVLFCLALVLQRTWQLSPLAAGMALVPVTVAVGCGAFVSGRLIARWGPKAPMFAGASAGLVGSAGLALAGHELAWFFAASVLFGCCSLAMPAMTSVAMGAVPDRPGLAAGVLNAARQTGGAIGVAVVGGFAPETGMWLVSAGYVLIACLVPATSRRTDRPLRLSRSLRRPGSGR